MRRYYYAHNDVILTSVHAQVM